MAGSNRWGQAGSACSPLLVMEESDKGVNRDHALLGKYRYNRSAIVEARELSFGARNLTVSIATGQGYIPSACCTASTSLPNSLPSRRRVATQSNIKAPLGLRPFNWLMASSVASRAAVVEDSEVAVIILTTAPSGISAAKLTARRNGCSRGLSACSRPPASFQQCCARRILAAPPCQTSVLSTLHDPQRCRGL